MKNRPELDARLRAAMASTLATVAVRAFAGDATPRPYVNVPFTGHADAIPMAPGSIEAELLKKYGGGASSSAPLASSSSPSSPYVDPLSRVMPTIFVAGPAKSGSTFLWDCLQASFHPETHGQQVHGNFTSIHRISRRRRGCQPPENSPFFAEDVAARCER